MDKISLDVPNLDKKINTLCPLKTCPFTWKYLHMFKFPYGSWVLTKIINIHRYFHINAMFVYFMDVGVCVWEGHKVIDVCGIGVVCEFFKGFSTPRLFLFHYNFPNVRDTFFHSKNRFSLCLCVPKCVDAILMSSNTISKFAWLVFNSSATWKITIIMSCGIPVDVKILLIAWNAMTTHCFCFRLVFWCFIVCFFYFVCLQLYLPSELCGEQQTKQLTLEEVYSRKCLWVCLCVYHNHYLLFFFSSREWSGKEVVEEEAKEG